MANLIRVSIKNRKKTFVNEDALSVTSYNQKGVFDILPFHANFITLINKLLTVRTNSHEYMLQFSEGVLMVQNDVVNIFISDLEPYFESKKITM
jgi:F0F1-type ATP synthase epsilon subunit